MQRYVVLASLAQGGETCGILGQQGGSMTKGTEPGDTERNSRAARQFIEAIPFSLALGMDVIEIGDGRAAITMPWSEALVGDRATGVVHGGAVSALMDTCGGAAVMSHADAPSGSATLDLRIDYMRPAVPGQTITARAECYHVTRSVAFVRITAHDDDPDRPVAAATGAFTVERANRAAGAA
jgi:uncharacterized protein (TIGR00369 family)